MLLFLLLPFLGLMKVTIIGGGVAGLAAGCYLQMSGFETIICERGLTAGGLCTSWKKGAYTFESGFQWLMGSGPANPFYKLWSEILDMDSITFVNHEVRMDIEVRTHADPRGNKIFHLYANLDRLRSYLLEISPEDRLPVESLIRSMRKIQSFEIPPEIRSVPELIPPLRKIKFIKHLPLLFFLKGYKKETNFTFARKLKSPFLCEAFELLFDGEEQPLMIITIPLAFNDLQATGYPIGGASAMVNKMRDRYVELGGNIRYRSGVTKILTEKNRATGVELETRERVLSDYVISVADWHFTMLQALEGKYLSKKMIALKEEKDLKIYPSVIIVSLGISRKLDQEAHFIRFPLSSELVSPDGTVYHHLESHIYNYDPTLAPAGKTVVSFSFYTEHGDYWISLRKTDREAYDRNKTEFSEKVIDLAEKIYGNIRACIEEADVATPATFHRYTNNYRGSVQGWMPGKNIIAQSPVKLTVPGLSNFYFAGHWTIPGGGLPVAIKSARDAVQMLCDEAGTPFRSFSP